MCLFLGVGLAKGVSFEVFFLGETRRGQLLEKEELRKSARGKGCERGGIAPPPVVSFCSEDLCSGYIFGVFFFSGYCLRG